VARKHIISDHEEQMMASFLNKFRIDGAWIQEKDFFTKISDDIN